MSEHPKEYLKLHSTQIPTFPLSPSNLFDSYANVYICLSSLYSRSLFRRAISNCQLLILFFQTKSWLLVIFLNWLEIRNKSRASFLSSAPSLNRLKYASYHNHSFSLFRLARRSSNRLDPIWKRKTPNWKRISIV